jgi:hypothetical protein
MLHIINLHITLCCERRGFAGAYGLTSGGARDKWSIICFKDSLAAGHGMGDERLGLVAEMQIDFCVNSSVIIHEHRQQVLIKQQTYTKSWLSLVFPQSSNPELCLPLQRQRQHTIFTPAFPRNKPVAEANTQPFHEGFRHIQRA